MRQASSLGRPADRRGYQRYYNGGAWAKWQNMGAEAHALSQAYAEYQGQIEAYNNACSSE
jgi:hypothetical protein